MSITYSIDGVALDNSSGKWSLTGASQVSAGAAARAVNTVVPGLDGVVPGPTEALEAPTLSLALTVNGVDDADLQLNLGTLLATLRDGTAITRTAGTASRTSRFKFMSATAPDYAPDPSASFIVVGQLPEVFWRGSVADFTKTGATSGTAYAVTTLNSSTGPVTDALILITGPCNNPRITDLATGSWAQLTLTLAAGEKALIDCAAWTVRRGAAVTFAGGGTAATSSLSTSGGPTLLELNGAAQGGDPFNRQVRVSLSGTGFTSATSLAIRARPSDIA